MPCSSGSMSELGHTRKSVTCSGHVRFAPQSRPIERSSEGPKRATSGRPAHLFEDLRVNQLHAGWHHGAELVAVRCWNAHEGQL